MVDDLLPEGEPVARGYISSRAVRRMIDDDREGKQDYSRQLWHLLSLHWWLNNSKSPLSIEGQIA
jgi:asparagine synthase (glutamine-hydrolysing)